MISFKKIHHIVLLSMSIESFALGASEYENYLKKHNDQFVTYQKDIDNAFEAYKKAHEEAIKEYKAEILKKWPTAELGTNLKWVEYDRAYNTKKVIDYEKEEIRVALIAKNPQEAEKKISKIFGDLYDYDLHKGFTNDILEQKISKKLGQIRELPKSNEKFLADAIDPDKFSQMKDGIVAANLREKRIGEDTIYEASVKFPKDMLLKKAIVYKEIVNQQAKKLALPSELIFGIIRNESGFNPMAKSHIPAIGLMQIVPHSAGVDAYYTLHGKKEILSHEYLYDSTNNIILGTTYLSLLDKKYLQGIKDPISKLYCTIAAYNTGSGNVARAFGGKNIKEALGVINKESNDWVYKQLLNKLPYKETQKYLVKVKYTMEYYKKQKELLE